MAKFIIDLSEENIPRAADILFDLFCAGQNYVTQVDYSGALMSLLLSLDAKKVD